MQGETVKFDDGRSLVAFWDYAHYPYLLWGDVSKIDSAGRVQIPSVQGWWWPRIVLPKGKAKALITVLEELKKQKGEEMLKVEREYSEKLGVALGTALLKSCGLELVEVKSAIRRV